jgi:hypothetical protein
MFDDFDPVVVENERFEVDEFFNVDRDTVEVVVGHVQDLVGDVEPNRKRRKRRERGRDTVSEGGWD